MVYLVNMFNPSDIKKDFPIFNQYPELIFVDNASTTHKPYSVIEAVSDYYKKSNANVHRAVYELGIQSDEIYENTRRAILEFYNLRNSHEVIYTHGTTDGFNKLARSIEHIFIPGDNVIVSEMEHHSNLIPWQEMCKRKEIELRLVNLTENGELDYDQLGRIVDKRTRLVSLVHISNTLGTINDLARVRTIIGDEIFFFVDVAQSCAMYGDHFGDLKADGLVFGAHKMFGPSGIGAILASQKLLSKLEPFNYGGGMVTEVNRKTADYRKDISRYESGTPPLAQVAGLQASMAYLRSLEAEKLRMFHRELIQELRRIINDTGGKVMGEAQNYSGLLSCYWEDIHPHDVASYLNAKNIAVRAGHHCTQLIMKKYKVFSSVRFSFSIYNDHEDVKSISHAIQEMISYFK